MKRANLLAGQVGLFFVVNGELFLHTCSLEKGEQYGAFTNYPYSHDDIWQREYYGKFHVDFDYFPRGRIVYNRKADSYTIYHDKCIVAEALKLSERYRGCHCTLALDEHYQCSACNKDYVV